MLRARPLLRLRPKLEYRNRHCHKLAHQHIGSGHQCEFHVAFLYSLYFREHERRDCAHPESDAAL